MIASSPLPTLRKFPAEVRIPIYHLVLAGAWNGKTLPLIIALRGEPDLYHEALKVFCDTNTFTFSGRNLWMCMIKARDNPPSMRGWDHGDTSYTAMQSIRHAKLDLPEFPDSTLEKGVLIRTHLYHRVLSIISQCKFTTISFGITLYEQMYWFLIFVNFLSKSHKSLTDLSISISREMLERHGIQIAAHLQEISDDLRIRAKPCGVSTAGPVLWSWASDGARLSSCGLELSKVIKSLVPPMGVMSRDLSLYLSNQTRIYLMYGAKPSIDGPPSGTPNPFSGIEALFDLEDLGGLTVDSIDEAAGLDDSNTAASLSQEEHEQDSEDNHGAGSGSEEQGHASEGEDASDYDEHIEADLDEDPSDEDSDEDCMEEEESGSEYGEDEDGEDD